MDLIPNLALIYLSSAQLNSSLTLASGVLVAEFNCSCEEAHSHIAVIHLKC